MSAKTIRKRRGASKKGVLLASLWLLQIIAATLLILGGAIL
jgi:hypothetical protein